MTTIHPSVSSAPPPVATVGPVAWIRKNLFSGWFNSLLTIVIGFVLIRAILGFLAWATTTAQWRVIPANLPLYFVGRYPANQYWRMWVLLALLTSMAGLTWGILARYVPRLFDRAVLIGVGIVAVITVLIPMPVPYRLLLLAIESLVLVGAWLGRLFSRKIPKLGNWLSLAWVIVFFVGLWLIAGGLGLKAVATNLWGGLLLTLFMSIVSIVLCFPIGILLALGRQSSLPVVRWLSVAYIELVRGIPLIAFLFFGSVMLPLFLSKGVRPDLVLRAIVALTLFSAAYLAENIRGGLQSIPKGQVEAANALGLNPTLTTALIVLPQALKVSIPAIVGQFISLFQDTTLVSIIGLLDLLGMSRAILANPQFIGRYPEVYLFIGVIFWLFCYAMSWASRRIERQLEAGGLHPLPTTQPLAAEVT